MRCDVGSEVFPDRHAKPNDTQAMLMIVRSRNYMLRPLCWFLLLELPFPSSTFIHSSLSILRSSVIVIVYKGEA